jgi:hypothetical protein
LAWMRIAEIESSWRKLHSLFNEKIMRLILRSIS